MRDCFTELYPYALVNHVSVSEKSRYVSRAMSGICFFYFLIIGLIGPFMAQELAALEATAIDFLLALPVLMSLFVAPIWGAFADRFQSWKIALQLAVLFMFLGLGGIIFLPVYWIVGSMLVHSIGRAAISPLVDSIILQQLSDRALYGSVRRWGSIGFAAGALLGAGIQQLGFSSVLPTAAVLSALFLLSCLRLPEPPPLQSVALKDQVKGLLRDKMLMLMLLGGVFHFVPLVCSDIFLSTHLASLEIEPLWTGIAISAGIAVEVVVLSYSAHILASYRPSLIFMVAVLLGIVRFLGMNISSAGWQIFCCQALHGFCFGLFWIAIVEMVAARTVDKMPATGQSLLSAVVVGLGAGVGIAGASWLVRNYDTTALFQANFIFECLAFVICLILIGVSRAQRAQEQVL